MAADAVSKKLSSMCEYLGIEEREKKMYWIAELALLAKLPAHWKEYKAEEGHAYFHNHVTGATSWSHPRDNYFFELVKRERQHAADLVVLIDQQVNPIVFQCSYPPHPHPRTSQPEQCPAPHHSHHACTPTAHISTANAGSASCAGTPPLLPTAASRY